jgi:hypothetical protein
MAETPDEIYERIKQEEQAKGSSPTVAEARAKAARVRAQRGLPIDPAAAAAASAAAPKPAAEQPAAEQPAAEQPAAEKPEQEQPAAEQVAAEQPPAEQPAAEQPAAAAVDGAGNGGERAGTEPVPAGVAAPAAAGAAPRGRGASARAARAQTAGAVPERIQRLLAVVKPEAIQRVEREPIDRVNVWPHLMASEFLALLVITAALIVVSALVDAPFRELANINQTPNPSKAPWYFLALQELLRYFHPLVAGVTIPQWIIFALIATPYIDRNASIKPGDRKLAIVMFTIFVLFFAILTIVGMLFRGPGFNWVYPWEDGLFYLRPLEHGFEL